MDLIVNSVFGFKLRLRIQLVCRVTDDSDTLGEYSKDTGVIGPVGIVIDKSMSIHTQQ